jgi:4-amino-4-deoxy-L-arabinose transferase-like glycosyltransferase
MTHQDQSKFPSTLIALGVFVYIALQAIFVGQAGIGGSSEARESQVVDVILREGNWILPLRNGVIPSKPPLYHWLAAGVSIVAGGVSEFSMRFTSQICCAVVIVLVSLVTFKFASLTRLYQSVDHPRRSALLAAAISSLTYGLYQMGCLAMVDMTFTLTLWSALSAVVLGVRHDPDRGFYLGRLGCALFWLFCAFAVLARGPLGVVLPVALVGVAGVCTVGLRRTVLLFLKPSLGWLAFALPLVWYYLAYQIGGEAFVDRQILFENLKRLSGGEHVNSEAWWFYLPSVLRTSAPWGLVLLLFFLKSLRERRTLSYAESSPLRRALSRWLPGPLLLFAITLLSISSGKRHSYLVPILPLIAVQLGVEISSAFERGGATLRARLLRVGRRTEVWLTTFAMLAFFGISVVLELGILSNPNIRDAYNAIPMIVAWFGVLIAACGLLAFIGVRRGLFGTFASLWFLILVLMTGIVNGGLAVKAHLKGFDDIARTWLQTAARNERLAVFKHPFDEYFDPILFYVRRSVDLLSLDSFSRECNPSTVYAAKRSWLDAHDELFKGDIIRIVTLRERLLARRSDSSRDLVFFRCSALGRGALGKGALRGEGPKRRDGVGGVAGGGWVES